MMSEQEVYQLIQHKIQIVLDYIQMWRDQVRYFHEDHHYIELGKRQVWIDKAVDSLENLNEVMSIYAASNERHEVMDATSKIINATSYINYTQHILLFHKKRLASGMFRLRHSYFVNTNTRGSIPYNDPVEFECYEDAIEYVADELEELGADPYFIANVRAIPHIEIIEYPLDFIVGDKSVFIYRKSRYDT